MRVPDGNVRYFCKLCQLQQSYARVELLKQHIMVKHCGLMPHKCQYCEMRFANSGSRLNHERQVHTGEKKFPCRICGELFFTTALRSGHERTHQRQQRDQPKSDDPPLDDEDDSSASNAVQMILASIAGGKKERDTEEPAAINHHENDENEHDGDVGGVGDEDGVDYEPQLRRHQCQFCQRWFTDATTLTRHVESWHSMEREYRCSYCGEVFDKFNQQIIHELQQHKEEFD